MVVQQLGVSPFPAEVGQEVTVLAQRAMASTGPDRPLGPLVGLPVQVESPDGRRQSLGVTDEKGLVRFVPTAVGSHVFRAEVAGVQIMAPHRVVPARPRWVAAIVSIPLGLALLWQHLRRRSALVPRSGAGD